MDYRERLEALLKRRDEAAAKIQRLRGRLEEAEKNLTTIEAECRAKGLDPEKLDTILAALESNLEQALIEMESTIKAAELALVKYNL